MKRVKPHDIDWNKMIIIAAYDNPMVAHIVKGRLITLGINCLLADRNTAVEFGKKDVLVGNIKLMVNIRDQHRALHIIEDEFEEDIDKEDRFEEGKCPRCKSSDIVYEKAKISFVILNILLLGLPGLFYRRKWICMRCEYEWNEY